MLPHVDFYQLKDENTLNAACLVLEHAYLNKQRVFVLAQDKSQAEALDELLWNFKPEAFIPHHLQGEGPTPPPPIQIGFGPAPSGFNEILLNLSETIPEFFSRFKKIIEFVANDEKAKEISREHYRDYRAKGCALKFIE